MTKGAQHVAEHIMIDQRRRQFEALVAQLMRRYGRQYTATWLRRRAEEIDPQK